MFLLYVSDSMYGDDGQRLIVMPLRVSVEVELVVAVTVVLTFITVITLEPTVQ